MKCTAVVAAIGVCASLAAGQSAAPTSSASAAAPRIAPIAAAEFEKLMKELVARGAQPWETIPWRTDLVAARSEAIASSRPLFLWAMNGHPLGCT